MDSRMESPLNRRDPDEAMRMMGYWPFHRWSSPQMGSFVESSPGPRPPFLHWLPQYACWVMYP